MLLDAHAIIDAHALGACFFYEIYKEFQWQINVFVLAIFHGCFLLAFASPVPNT